MAEHSEPLSEALALVVPGTPLREGLDRVLQAKRGALVVVGDDPAVLSICTGGFLLDAEFTPQRMSELAKMDGAIILTPDATRIARANVHLMPRASIPTTETGTRHRTAERVARSIDVPVISVSEAMATVTVYRGAHRHTLQRTGRLLDLATQAMSAVERFKDRLDLALALLSTLEVEDTVSLGDVVAVLQPGEMVVRLFKEVQGYLLELGEDGRLIGLQLEELVAGVEDTLRLVVRDYLVLPDGQASGAAGPEFNGRALGEDADRVHLTAREARVDAALAALHALPYEDLAGGTAIGGVLGVKPGPGSLDLAVEARGYRLLHRLPRVSDAIVERIVARFTTLPRLMQASLAELEKVGGVGEAKARAVKDGLARMVEASILERYE